MNILAFESSCDETSASVLEADGNKIKILSGIKKRASDVKSKTLLLLRFISLLYIGCRVCRVACLRSD